MGFGWLVFNLERQPLPNSGSFPRPGAADPPRCGLGAPPLPSPLTGNSRPARSVAGSGPDGAGRARGVCGDPAPTGTRGRRGRPGTAPSRQPLRSLRAGAGGAVPPALGGERSGERSLHRLLPPSCPENTGCGLGYARAVRGRSAAGTHRVPAAGRVPRQLLPPPHGMVRPAARPGL